MSDELEDILAPRRSNLVRGQDSAERQMLSALNSGRLHHAWLLSGPKSCGKATFAYVVAKILLANAYTNKNQTTISISSDLPAAKKVSAGSHADLFLLSRKWDSDKKKISTAISVDEVRKLHRFFSATAGEGGWRVVIVDKADDLNTSSANALLKVLEEPPKKSIFFLLTDNPNKLLPTIKSRCRRANFKGLNEEAVRAIGSDLNLRDNQIVTAIGDSRLEFQMAQILSQLGAAKDPLSAEIHGLARLTTPLGADQLQLIDKLCAKNNDALFHDFLEQVDAHIHNSTVSSAIGGSQNKWLQAYDKVNEKRRRTEIFNLDKKQLVLDIISHIQAAQSS